MLLGILVIGTISSFAESARAAPRCPAPRAPRRALIGLRIARIELDRALKSATARWYSLLLA
jgi:hypothetical protein